MTTESAPSKSRVLVAMLALLAFGIVVRSRFVDVLTKTTGTWIGGVESPHRAGPGAETVSTGSSGG